MENTPHIFDLCRDEGSHCGEGIGTYEMSLESAREWSSDVDDLGISDKNNLEGSDDVNNLVKVKAAEEVQRKQAAKGTKRPSKLQQTISKWKSERQRFAREMPLTIEVFHQACFYLGAFYCTHIWSTSNRIHETVTGDTLFHLSAIHAFFDPFQGFLNFLVYQRPRFIQIQKHHPAFSRIKVALFVLRFTFMGGKNDASQTRVSTKNRNGVIK